MDEKAYANVSQTLTLEPYCSKPYTREITVVLDMLDVIVLDGSGPSRMSKFRVDPSEVTSRKEINSSQRGLAVISTLLQTGNFVLNSNLCDSTGFIRIRNYRRFSPVLPMQRCFLWVTEEIACNTWALISPVTSYAILHILRGVNKGPLWRRGGHVFQP